MNDFLELLTYLEKTGDWLTIAAFAIILLAVCVIVWCFLAGVWTLFGPKDFTTQEELRRAYLLGRSDERHVVASEPDGTPRPMMSARTPPGHARTFDK